MSVVWVEDLSLDGATVGVFEYPSGFKSVCISDKLIEQYRIMLSPQEDGAVSVRIDLEYSEDRPSELANFTDDKRILCTASDTLEISDSGLFSAQSRAMTGGMVTLHFGLTLQLPASSVPVVRRGIEMARALAAQKLQCRSSGV